MKYSRMVESSKPVSAAPVEGPLPPGVAGQDTPSLSVPEGMTQAEFAMREAIKGFRRANQAKDLKEALDERRDAITNLAHAWLWAVRCSGQVPADVARGLFGDLNDAASRW